MEKINRDAGNTSDSFGKALNLFKDVGTCCKCGKFADPALKGQKYKGKWYCADCLNKKLKRLV